MRVGSLELWGGPECTVNRVGDWFTDQLIETGHDGRIDDLALLAGLGFSALRYPLLWERIAPVRADERDWRWTDQRLAKLRELGLRPIAGLVHHGSGPRYTNLLAEDFATGLATHARAVAERYEWIEEWTPINEPVTTARFSALYGHWYPHRRDERAFWQALLNQIDGTRLAMAAIRAVNPAARLIQTEDLGRTWATATMRDQAAFDNVRRWAGWDLLYGRLVRGHPLWDRICRFGFEDRLREIADAPCPPDIIGVNHYLTSDRFLDHRVRLYPADRSGFNGARAYADVEAVRVVNPHPPGVGGVLREAWARYRRPLALTEVHNGCTREEQLRWMQQAWSTALNLRAEGIDVHAVTAWSLFGSSGWDRLLTGGGTYESGAYDTRSGSPRPTAVARLLTQLASDTPCDGEPVLQGQGWWHRPIRYHHPVVPRASPMSDHLSAPDWRDASSPPLVITGATGTLGQALAAACRHRAIRHVLLSRRALDLNDTDSIAAALDRHRPWAVVNAAGWVRVDEAETEQDACLAANAWGAAALADACAKRGIATVSFSSDLVFDGSAGRPYVETDVPGALNVYGRSKLAMEQALASKSGSHLIVRTAAFFSPFDRHNFAVHVLEQLAAGMTVAAADDLIVTPTYVPHLCDAVLDLVIDGATGLWHLTNGDAVSWATFARLVAEAVGLDPGGVRDVPGRSLAWAAARPANVALGTVRGALLPPLEEALACFARDRPQSANSLSVSVAQKS